MPTNVVVEHPIQVLELQSPPVRVYENAAQALYRQVVHAQIFEQAIMVLRTTANAASAGDIRRRVRVRAVIG